MKTFQRCASSGPDRFSWLAFLDYQVCELGIDGSLVTISKASAFAISEALVRNLIF